MKYAFFLVSFLSSFAWADRQPAGDSVFNEPNNRNNLTVERVFERPQGAKHNQIYMTTSRAVAAMLTIPDELESLKQDIHESQEELDRVKRHKFLTEEDRLQHVQKVRKDKSIPFDERALRIKEAYRAPLYKDLQAWESELNKAQNKLSLQNENIVRASMSRGILPQFSKWLRVGVTTWFVAEIIIYGVNSNFLHIETGMDPSFPGIRYYVKLRDKEKFDQEIDALSAYYDIVEK